MHRDLKSDNILLCTNPRDDMGSVVKLIDFGAGHWAKTGPLQANRCNPSIGAG